MARLTALYGAIWTQEAERCGIKYAPVPLTGSWLVGWQSEFGLFRLQGVYVTSTSAGPSSIPDTH